MKSNGFESKRTKRTRQLFAGGIAFFLIMSVAAGVSLVAVQPAGAQSPTPISSCTTITSSGIYALTTDITGSAGETCIDVRADDVVFDGGGHAVDGVDASNSTSIRSVSRTNVTVENVRLGGWMDGIHVETNTGDTLRNVVADNNTNAGILLNNSTSIDVRDSTTNGNYYGIYSRFGDDETLTNVTTTNNRDGIVLRRSKSSNTVTNTTATDNQVGIYAVFSSDTTIANTNASGNNFSGIGVR